jgi:hypothetical protein
MTPALSLIYGDQVVDDIDFCNRYQDVIERYTHGIMTLQGSPLKTLESVARNPASVPGWAHSLAIHQGGPRSSSRILCPPHPALCRNRSTNARERLTSRYRALVRLGGRRLPMAGLPR